MAADAPRPRKLSLFEFSIACEAIEGKITATFSAAQKAAEGGNLAEVERLSDLCDALSARLEALIEGQLMAAGEARPAAPTLAA